MILLFLMFLSYMICLVILYGWTLEHQENLKDQKLIDSSEIEYFQLLYIFSLYKLWLL